MHNWVHKVDLQPESGKNPDHVAVDETVIQLNDELYWLYAAVDVETNELLHTTLKTTRNTMIDQQFLAEINEIHDVPEAVFLVDGAPSLQTACRRIGYDFRCENMEIRMLLNVSFGKQNVEQSASRTVLATLQQKQLTTGSNHSASHGIKLSEHYYILNDNI